MMSPTLATTLLAVMAFPASCLSLTPMHTQQSASHKVRAGHKVRRRIHDHERWTKATGASTSPSMDRAVQASDSSKKTFASEPEANGWATVKVPAAPAQVLDSQRHLEFDASSDKGLAWNDMDYGPNQNEAPILGSDLGWPYVNWSMCEARYHSNLAGVGPDTGEQSIRYYNIATAGLGRGVDLVVTANSPYVANDIYENGMRTANSCFGQVNVQSDTSVEILFSLYLTGTNTSVAFDRLFFTIYDLDSSPQAVESFTLYNRVHKVYLYPGHEMQVSGNLSTGLTFTSTVEGVGGDNPKKPQKLTELQKKRSVMVDYVRQAQWKVTFSVAGGNGGRNFLFAGRSDVDKTEAPTPSPSASPTVSPTPSPTASPTTSPTQSPTLSPTPSPTALPSPAPTSVPTPAPSPSPTASPSASPTVFPTVSPTASPSASPTASPTSSPTAAPTPVQRAETTLPPKDKGTTTTTTACESCIIWGDPHIITFGVHKKRLAEHPQREAFFRTRKWEADELSIYEAGTFWLFSSADVRIQGRYVKNTTNPKFTSLGGLAVGGPFLGGNQLVIRPLEAKVEWNGEEILSKMPSEFANSFVRARYSKSLELVASGRRGPAIQVLLPDGVSLMVNRWQHSLAAKISMCKSPVGLSQGQCGSLNGHAAESKLLAMQLEDQRLSSVDSMFAEDQ